MQVAEAVVHLRRAGARTLLAVDPERHLDVGAVAGVRGRDAGSEHVRAVPVLGLARPHAERQLATPVCRGPTCRSRSSSRRRARASRRARCRGLGGRSRRRSRAPGRADRSRRARESPPRGRSRCRASPCSRRAPRTRAAGSAPVRVPPASAPCAPGRSGSRATCAAGSALAGARPRRRRRDESAARAAASAASPASTNAIMSPSNAQSITASSRRTPTRPAVPAPVS